MQLFLIGKSNGGVQYIDDSNRGSTTKRHKWAKEPVITSDPIAGTDETRFPLTYENFRVRYVMSSDSMDLDAVIDSVKQGTFPVIEIHMSPLFGESSVSVVDKVSVHQYKTKLFQTITSTNVELDPKTFSNGVTELIHVVGHMNPEEED